MLTRFFLEAAQQETALDAAHAAYEAQPGQRFEAPVVGFEQVRMLAGHSIKVRPAVGHPSVGRMQGRQQIDALAVAVVAKSVDKAKHFANMSFPR